MEYLYDLLKEHCGQDYYPFHMPGHKRRLHSIQEHPFAIDITEIDGFDNLHHPEDILKEAQQRAARLYGSEESHFLINGSTAGILSAVSACAFGGRTEILMARNSHKAAYHAVYLNRLSPVYLYPEPGEVNGPIGPEQVKAALEAHPQVCCVFLTSPTYDGIVSDINAIADIAHARQIPLIVDEAHGAHFGMHPDFPENSVKLGADYVIHSLHKTLPSLTQTALLHVNGALADRRRLRRFLGIYQTSSPSYVLMASIDECIRMLEEKGDALFGQFFDCRRDFSKSVSDLNCLRMLDTDDVSKILIQDGTGRLSGLELYQLLLRKYHLQPEMAAGSYVLMLCSVGDTREGFKRLAEALHEVDRTLDGHTECMGQAEGMKRADSRMQAEGMKRADSRIQAEETYERPKVRMSIAGAQDSEAHPVQLEDCADLISAEYIYLYPPGIPLVVPGEVITEQLLERLLQYRSRGYSLQGMEDYEMNTLLVV